MKTLEKQNGLTLIEIIVVIAIISILAVVAMGYFLDLRTKATENAEAYTVGAVQAGINMYNANEAINP